MEFAKGLQVVPGSVLIFPTDEAVSQLQEDLKITTDRMKQLSPWRALQDFLTFRDDNLYRQVSGQYQSQGGLDIDVDFEGKTVTRLGDNRIENIVDIIEVEGVKIIVIPELFMTQQMADAFVADYWLLLGRDTFTLLARAVEPRDVVRLCGTNRKLQTWCDESFYRDMLRHHFEMEADDPKRLFFDLTGPKVWACGDDLNGKLGLGPEIGHQFGAVPIETLSNVIAMSVGDTHSLFLDRDGGVWGCGMNDNNELGLDKTGTFYFPMFVPNLPKMVAICASSGFSLFLDVEGMVWTCGLNDYGQLGLGHRDQVEIPTPIVTLPTVVAMSASDANCLFLDENGHVWACGDNDNHQLGLDSNRRRYNSPTLIPNLPKMKAISTGTEHSLFLDREGGVWVCGTGYGGKLGLGKVTSQVVPIQIPRISTMMAISAGFEHSLFLDVEGNVWGCGDNRDRQLGLDNVKKVKSPKLIESLYNMYNITAISAGHGISLFLDRDGQVWACGSNEQGSLGFEIERQINTPTLVPELPKIRSISTSGSVSMFLELL